jgi:glutathionyl-hydroquinone reductase
MRIRWLLWLLLPMLLACSREADRITVVSEQCPQLQRSVISKKQMKLGQSVTISLVTQSEYLTSIEILPKKVEFLIEDRVIGEDNTQPYTFIWTPKVGDQGIPKSGSVDLPVYTRTVFENAKCEATVRGSLITVIVTEP